MTDDGSADWVVATDRERQCVALIARLAQVNVELNGISRELHDLKLASLERMLGDAEQFIAIVKMRIRESINE